MVSAISFFALEGCLYLSFTDRGSQIEGYGSTDSGFHLSFTSRESQIEGENDSRILADCEF